MGWLKLGVGSGTGLSVAGAERGSSTNVFNVCLLEFLQKYDKSPANSQGLVVILSSIISGDIPILARNFNT